MEKLTTIQEARLKCLEMSNEIYSNLILAKQTSFWETEKVIERADTYLDYVLEGMNKNAQQA